MEKVLKNETLAIRLLNHYLDGKDYQRLNQCVDLLFQMSDPDSTNPDSNNPDSNNRDSNNRDSNELVPIKPTLKDVFEKCLGRVYLHPEKQVKIYLEEFADPSDGIISNDLNKVLEFMDKHQKTIGQIYRKCQLIGKIKTADIDLDASYNRYSYLKVKFYGCQVKDPDSRYGFFFETKYEGKEIFYHLALDEDGYPLPGQGWQCQIISI